MMTLWTIFRFPLMFGGELRDNDEWTLSLLTNKEVLHLHRFGKGGRQVELNEEYAIWTSEDEQGNHYVALFNLSDEESTLQVSFQQLMFQFQKRYVIYGKATTWKLLMKGLRRFFHRMVLYC